MGTGKIKRKNLILSEKQKKDFSNAIGKVGIYLITNTINGKQYIGKSQNIGKRWQYHINAARSSKIKTPLLCEDLRKYGAICFEFKIISECCIQNLNELEIFYIAEYKTQSPFGYNITKGGTNCCAEADNNANSKLTSKDVYEIRELYNTDISKSNAYEQFKHIVSINTFADVWNGKTWKSVHYDVYTQENRRKHKHQKGRPHRCVISKEDALFIRDCKNKGMNKSEVLKKFFPNVNYNTFSDAWYGNSYPDIKSDIPPVEVPTIIRNGTKCGADNPHAVFSEADVRNILSRKMNGEKIRIVHRDYPNTSKNSFSGLWYGKRYQKLYREICGEPPLTKKNEIKMKENKNERF